MQHWLMKTEPDVFSFEDLVKAKNKTTHWEGVRNYQARNFMRDTFKKGDKVFIYHSNIEEPGIFGIAEVVREGYPDHAALDPKSKYYDEEAAKKGKNPWVMVDVRAIHRMQSPVLLSQWKTQKGLEKMMGRKKGARLSVQPVTPEEFKLISSLGKPKSL